MGKPQIGHFVAANEDFPEFKPPKVARVGFVGYLTINYLPTHALPNIILHYTFLHYNIIFQHHLSSSVYACSELKNLLLDGSL